MSINEVDCTPFFDHLGPRERTRERIVLGLTEHTYFPDGESRTGWLPKVSRAFEALACPTSNGRVDRGTVCIIGCGPAIDGILAVEILRPQLLILTDVHEDVVAAGRNNVLRNCLDPAITKIDGYVSDLCEALIQRHLKVDMIYENLPNLPARDVDVDAGALSASFFSISEAQRRIVPPEYDRHMLGLHYRCLKDARECLRPGGEVVSCIGARIPQNIIIQMFRDLGYNPTLLVVDLVQQFEAEKVLAEYARVERETAGLEFMFYDMDESRGRLDELVRRGVQLEALASEMANLGIGFNAQTAVERHAIGKDVAVVGLVIRGVL